MLKYGDGIKGTWKRRGGNCSTIPCPLSLRLFGRWNVEINIRVKCFFALPQRIPCNNKFSYNTRIILKRSAHDNNIGAGFPV